MSCSCVGTCSACGAQKSWLSGTLALQLDDGLLKCLPHPGEGWACEQEGLTLSQASQRRRLFHETFFVCRRCGKSGTLIEQEAAFDESSARFTPAESLKWSAIILALTLPVALWFRAWVFAFAVVVGLLISHLQDRYAARKDQRELAARGLPRTDAPGSVEISFPTRSSVDAVIVGRQLASAARKTGATGNCCDAPDWTDATSVKDEDRIPCCDCGRGVMTVSDHAIH